MKKILSLLSLAFVFGSNVLAEISIENIGINEGAVDYEKTVFNKKVQITEGCKTIQNVFDDLYDQIGYTVINHTNLDVTKPVCSGYKFDKAGNLLDSILTDMNVTYRAVNDSIILEYTKEYSAKFPMQWDVEDTLNKLKEKYKNMKMYTFGQSIRVEGSRTDIEEAEKVIKRLRDWAHREIPFNITVSELNLGEKRKDGLSLNNALNKNAIIAKIPKKDGKSTKIKVTHGMAYPIHLEVGTVVFDLQKNRVILNGDKYISLSQINSYSFFRNGYQVSFSSPFGTHLY